ncbi:MAG TPA: DUF4190 domain-containing protein [Kofleriaceae bacterium]|jgi:type II secretory pathway pseudopilin PulG
MVNPGFPPAGAPAPRQGNGLAIAGMVLGILAVVLFWTTVVDVVIGALAIIFSVLGLKRARIAGVGRGMAMTGLITGIIGIALAAILVVIAMTAVSAFKDYMKKSKKSEASLQLNSIARHAKAYYAEHDEFPKGNAPLTPADDCCKGPNAKCPTSPADWNTPVWQALDFSIDEPTLYRYDYQSDGKTITAHAVGDLDCDGTPGTYELKVTSEGGIPATTITNPPSGTY